MGNLNMLRGTDRANRRSANREYAITDGIASPRLGFVESFALNAWSSVYTPRCLAELSLTTQPFRRFQTASSARERRLNILTMSAHLSSQKLAGETSP